MKHFAQTLLLAPTALFALAACNGGPQNANPFGPLSQEEFAALHELKEGAAPDLRGEMVQIADDGLTAYLSRAANEDAPAILVIHEWWGLNDHIKHSADRLAAEGYHALAIDLYDGVVATTPDKAMETMKGVSPVAATSVIRKAYAYIHEDWGLSAENTGVIGWCFGGKWSLNAGMAVDELDAVVVYYGGGFERDPANLETIGGEVLGIFGTQDSSIPLDSVEQLDQALETAGVPHAIETFDAAHAFANPSSGRYNAESAEAAWAQTQAFFARVLKDA